MKNVLFIGSLEEEPSEEKLRFLQNLVNGLLDAGCHIVNSNGKLLGQYITAAVIRYVSKKDAEISSFMTQYVPLQHALFPVCFHDREFLSYWSQMEFIRRADEIIVIGGGSGTAKEVKMAQNDFVEKSFSFLPHFGGFAGTCSECLAFSQSLCVDDVLSLIL